MIAEQLRRSRLTQVQEIYLKAIYQLAAERRRVPTSVLAQRLGISPPSVTQMVGRLSERSLVIHDRYRGQQLTEDGRSLALHLVRLQRLLEMFLAQALGYHPDEVHDEAERLEYAISERMEERIFEFLGRPEYGHAIPSQEGPVRAAGTRSLSDCRAGEGVIVRAVSDHDSDRLRELQRRGLRPGIWLRVLAGSKYESPIEAEMGRRRVSVPLGLARQVFVEEVSE